MNKPISVVAASAVNAAADALARQLNSTDENQYTASQLIDVFNDNGTNNQFIELVDDFMISGAIKSHSTVNENVMQLRAGQLNVLNAMSDAVSLSLAEADAQDLANSYHHAFEAIEQFGGSASNKIALRETMTEQVVALSNDPETMETVLLQVEQNFLNQLQDRILNEALSQNDKRASLDNERDNDFGI